MGSIWETSQDSLSGLPRVQSSNRAPPGVPQTLACPGHLSQRRAGHPSLTPFQPHWHFFLLLHTSFQPQGLCTCCSLSKNTFLCLGAPPSYSGLMGLPSLASCVKQQQSLPHPFPFPAIYFLSNTYHHVTLYYICAGLGFSVCLPCENLNAIKTQAQ